MSEPDKKPRDWRVRVEHILSAAEEIFLYTENLKWEDFLDDDKTKRAVERCFEIIGEAARHIPADVRDRTAEIPWRRIIAYRNVLAHDYDKSRDMMMWMTIQNELPDFVKALNGAKRTMEKE